jgi:homoserine kinase
MDVTAMIKDAVEKITKYGDLTKAFQQDPAATVKKVTGDKIPAEAIDKVVDGVKAKIKLDSAAGALGSIKKLF